MDDFPLVRRRQPSGALGYLNYPPEILNIIYQELFVNDNEILVFLCSSDPQLNDISLKRSTGLPPKTAKGGISWSHLLDDQYFVESNGRSAQFLRVCKQVWLEGSPVLYGNLNIAMRWVPWKEPCVDNFLGGTLNSFVHGQKSSCQNTTSFDNRKRTV